MSEEIDMQAIKAAAKKELGNISGIEGFGVSDRSLNIYVNNEEVKKQIPTRFRGVSVNCIVTGAIYTQI